jgi:hypothetical protein
MRDLKDNIDEFGFLTQSKEHGWDGGDTAQREGMFTLGMYLNEEYNTTELIQLKSVPIDYRARYELNSMFLEKGRGRYARHYDTIKWYGDIYRFSGDQLIPNIIVMGVLGLKKQLWRLFLAQLKRGLSFAWNTRGNGDTAENHGKRAEAWAEPLSKRDKWILDKKIPILKLKARGWFNYNWKIPDFILFRTLGLYIRAFRCWLAYPLLLVTDLLLVTGALNRVYVYGKDPDNVDDLNFINQLVATRLKMPTPLSELAIMIYRKRPLSATNDQSSFGPQTALDHYFRPEAGGPPINEVFRPVLRRILK